MKLFLTLITLVLCSKAMSQDTLDYSGGGRNIQVIVLSSNYQDIQKLNVWGGGIVGGDRTSFGGVSYFEPDRYLLNAYFGKGIGFDGNYFIKSWSKSYNLSQSIASESMGGGAITKYVAKMPAHKGVSVGPHFGVSHFNQNINNLRYRSKASTMAFGFTFLRIKHGQFKLNSNYSTKRGSKIVALHADFLWYFNHSYPLTEFVKIVPAGQDTNSFEGPELMTQVDYDIMNKSNENTIGARLYLEGNMTFWTRKGIIGIKYLWGVVLPADKRSMYYEKIGLTGGLGLSFNFL